MLWLVPAAGASPNDFADSRHAMVELLGPSVEFSVETIDRLDVGPGGKLRPFQPLGAGMAAGIDSGTETTPSE